LQQIYNELKGQGLNLIAVNSGDPAATIVKYRKEGKFTFPMAMDSSDGKVANLFKVQAYPTNYILDAEGKVVAAFVGFDEAAMKKALTGMGFKFKK